MMNQLTPIVKNLILLNVVIFAAMWLLPDQYKFVYNDYFSLHKPSFSLVHDASVQVDGVKCFVPKQGLELEGGTVIPREEIQATLDASPKLAQQYKGIFRADSFKPLQIITHFFSHSLTSILHILFNMMVLASFGPILETIMGPKRFLAFYLFCGVMGGVLISLLDPSLAPVVGASGAIFGVMVAFAMYFPKQKLSIMFLPFGFEARWFVPAIGIMSAVFVILQYLGIDAGGPISHFGHLAGMISAILFFYLEKYLPLGLNNR